MQEADATLFVECERPPEVCILTSHEVRTERQSVRLTCYDWRRHYALALALAVLSAYRVEAYSLRAFCCIELLGECVLCHCTEELLACYAVRDAHAVSVVCYVVGEHSTTICALCRSLVPCQLNASLHVSSLHVCKRSRFVETYVSSHNSRSACTVGGVSSDGVVVETSYW